MTGSSYDKTLPRQHFKNSLPSYMILHNYTCGTPLEMVSSALKLKQKFVSLQSLSPLFLFYF